MTLTRFRNRMTYSCSPTMVKSRLYQGNRRVAHSGNSRADARTRVAAC